MSKKYLVFDISNLLYRTFFAHKQESDTTIAGLATHVALMTLNKYFRQHRPDKIVMAFDRPSWRKDYTASELCLSGKPYKGNRRKDMSPSQQQKYLQFIGHLREFENLIIEHSTIISLVADKLEADDLIAGFCQRHPDDEIVIISSDSDLLQLLKHPNVSIMSPATDKPATLAEYDDSPEYYLFQKCIRGDSTDNVQSAYPRVRSTAIKKAYTDPFERVQMMQAFWKDEKGVEHRVQDLYEENQMLIDLAQQPETIRRKMDKALEEAETKQKKYSHFHLMKYLGKYQLDVISSKIDNYIPLLSK